MKFRLELKKMVYETWEIEAPDMETAEENFFDGEMVYDNEVDVSIEKVEVVEP